MKKGYTKKPDNPKPKNYADYLQDLVNRKEITPERRNEYILQAKKGYSFYDKKTYIDCR